MQPGFPTTKPSGTEVFALWRFAAKDTGRVCFYSATTVRELDWALMPEVMADQSHWTRADHHYAITAESTVNWNPGRRPRRATLDGQAWPCLSDQAVWMAPGHHVLTLPAD